MARAKANRLHLSSLDRLEQTFVTGSIKRDDYLLFSKMVLAGVRLTEAERERLGQLFDHLRIGQIKLID
jgi:hypothetical protein